MQSFIALKLDIIPTFRSALMLAQRKYSPHKSLHFFDSNNCIKFKSTFTATAFNFESRFYLSAVMLTMFFKMTKCIDVGGGGYIIMLNPEC